jgi:dTDP-glucose pyrophosphorylase
LLVSERESIHDVIARIDCGAKGIALVVNEEQCLVGTISDGDVRRVILASIDLDSPVKELLARKANTAYPEPVTAPLGTSRSDLLELMRRRVVRQIPLLDDKGRVVDLATWDELLPDQVLPLQAVIMAGGKGMRLRPLTEDVPKPMLPVGDQPVMELIVDQLRASGIKRVNVTTHYKGEQIVEHFGDGSDFGISLNYVAEDRPLGTAGALGLMDPPTEPLLVINGDIITRVDFRAMLAFHKEYKADLTVAVREYDLSIPYGVVESEGAFVHALGEKPVFNFFVNAGIYLLEPSVYRFIPNDQRFDMTDLIQRLLDEERPVANFPIFEYWLDIGQHEDYRQALEDQKNGRYIR